jgi:outer membrane protein assembly factor BamB
MNRAVAVLILTTCSAFAVADDWPAWRGPTGQGYCSEKNLPMTWSDKENVKWKVPLDNPAYSTPIAWGDKIFLTMGTPDGNVRNLHCLSRADGKQLWTTAVKYGEEEQRWSNYPYCHASPVTDGERVVVSFGSAGMHCYDFAGKKIWSRTDLGKWEHSFGNASSPVIYKDLCILWCGPNEKEGRNFLLAVDKATGKTVWEHDEQVGSWGTPVITEIEGHEQLLLGIGPNLKGFDPKTGKELWLCNGLTSTGKASHIYASPIVSNGFAVAMSGYGGAGLGPNGMALKLGGSGDITGNRLWQHSRNHQRVGSGIIVGDHCYILEDNGIPRCFELTTGTEVWNVTQRPSGRNWGSMVHADGKLYVMASDARTFIFAASPKYKLLATNSLGEGEPTNSSLAISNGEIFLRTIQHLWCISEKN